MAEYYTLADDKSVVPIDDATQWARAYEDRDKRRVGRTELGDDVLVSTVFLGLNHAYDEDGPPMIFETMVFKGDFAERAMWRYSTWAEAEAGHAHAVELAKARLDAGEPLEGIDDECAGPKDIAQGPSQ